MRAGHLFAGIDGIGLGLADAGPFEAAWFSENENAPSRVLAHHYPDVPNHGDITTIDYSKVEPVDMLTGGFPCQDISKAGRGAGIKEGTRSGLWFEYVRAIRELRPGLVIVENVATLLGRGLDVVLGDLAEAGFDAEWEVLRASDVGAPHRRERVFLIATTTDRDVLRRLHRKARQQPAEARLDAQRDAPASRHTAPADRYGPEPQRAGVHHGLEGTSRTGQGDGPERQRVRGAAGEAVASDSEWGEFGPAIRRWERVLGRPAPAPVTEDGEMFADYAEWHMGFPAGWTSILDRKERITALGNAVVPQCAELVGRRAIELVDNLAADDAPAVA